MAPTCTNCGGNDFVWANELRTGKSGEGGIALRPRSESPIGARVCRTCGHADLFLRDLSLVHQTHLWRPGEFVPIPRPQNPTHPHHHSAPAPPPPPPPVAEPAPAPEPAAPPAPAPVASPEPEPGPAAPEPPAEPEAPMPTPEPVAAKPKTARRRGSRAKASSDDAAPSSL